LLAKTAAYLQKGGDKIRKSRKDDFYDAFGKEPLGKNKRIKGGKEYEKNFYSTFGGIFSVFECSSISGLDWDAGRCSGDSFNTTFFLGPHTWDLWDRQYPYDVDGSRRF